MSVGRACSYPTSTDTAPRPVHKPTNADVSRTGTAAGGDGNSNDAGDGRPRIPVQVKAINLGRR